MQGGGSMERKKIILLLAAFCLLPVFPVNAADDTPVEITATEEDEHPIPDKYTTGVSGELTKVELGGSVGGISFKVSGTKDANVLNFAYPAAPIPDTAVIENCDFSDYNFNSVQESAITDRNITITFRNCKFGAVNKEAPDSKVFFVFENCSLKRFQGSNASFENCAIGGSYEDGMHPFRHISVKNSYFSDFNYVCSGGEYHTDAVHIFGKADIDVTDLTFEHCRFEAPYNQLEGSNSYVNACFMLAPEYSDASDVVVKDCIMNGGGFTIYASDGNKHGEFHSITDSRFENVRVGEAHLFGDIYPNMRSEGAEFINMSDVDSLYIGYVGKEESSTVFSVSNDTNTERTLRIVTDQGTYTETVPACPGGKTMRDVREKIDYPFDKLFSVPADVTYAVCYDVTDPENPEQIRFVNYGSEPVVLTKGRIMGEEEEKKERQIVEATAAPTLEEYVEGVIFEDIADHVVKAEADANGNLKSVKVYNADESTVDTTIGHLLRNIRFTDKDGEEFILTLAFTDGEWDWQYDSKDMGAYTYKDEAYMVAGGVVNQEANGLLYTGETEGWKFLAAGKVVRDHAGLVMYQDEWFWIDDTGSCDQEYEAIVRWSGADFLVHGGRLRTDFTGFTYDPQNRDKWYHITNGQVWGDGEITDITIEGGRVTHNVIKGVVQ